MATVTQFDRPASVRRLGMGAWMTSAAIALFALLLVKHFICDFVLQSKWQVHQKGIYGAPGGLVHSAIHVAGTLVALIAVMTPISLIVPVLIAEYVIHYHIDWGKEQVVRAFDWREGARFWNAIGFDQLLHGLTYLAIVAYVIGHV